MSTLTPAPPAPTAPRPYHFPSFERRTLGNGLTVWMVPLPGRELVNVHLVLSTPPSLPMPPNGSGSR
jgi:hypothetical protein